MITSLDNKKVKEWTKLHNKKYREDSFLLFDEKAIIESNNKKLLDTLIYVDKQPFSFDKTYEVSQDVMDKISKRNGLKYIGVCKKINESCNYKNRVLLLDNIQDPINLGRLIQLSYAFGFDSILLSENCCDLYHINCLDIAKEYLFRVNIKRCNLIDEIKILKKKGFKVYSTGLSKKTIDIKSIKKSFKMGFVLGNEGSGVSDEIFKVSDNIIKIDMNNLDSLNVAMAGSIVLYSFSNL